MTGRAIPQDDRICMKICSIHNKRNAALIFQIMRKCCVNNLTGDHNTKNTLTNFCFPGVYLKKRQGYAACDLKKNF